MAQNNQTQTTASKTTNWLLIALLAAFLIAALLTAYLTFVAVRDFVLSWSLTQLPGIAVSEFRRAAGHCGTGYCGRRSKTPRPPCRRSAGLPPSPGMAPAVSPCWSWGWITATGWPGQGAPRTDTMILLTLDPLTRTAGMLSIPRDLWVTIPGGFENNRINTAYSLGEQYKVPGGGPALAMDTVEDAAGRPGGLLRPGGF